MKKVFILIFLLSCFTVFAQQGDLSMEKIIKTPPNPPKLVNDYTSTLTADQRQALENKLVALDDSTSTQIAVVIVPSLDGYDVADAATELGTSWGVGGKKNNGVVLLIGKDDRKLNISPGYGLEGGLTDLTASHIIQDVIVPNFKGDDYYRGIDEGTDAIIKAVRGEYSTPKKAKQGKGGLGKLIFIGIIILFLLLSSSGGKKGGGFMSRRGYRNIVGPMILGNLLGGGGRGGGGGWGGGSSGGGGFGGFGGGSFGGGGASGSW